MTPQYLIDFEEEIAEIYKQGLIRAPIHLRDGGEEKLIEIFKDVHPQDYIFCTWSSHLEALHRVPREEVKRKILEGKSISLNWPEYRFYSSAIVAGIFGIAVGLAHSIKLRNDEDQVWCFAGDMAYHHPDFWGAFQFAVKNDLKISFVCGDNGKSVCTPTELVCLSTEDIWNIYQDLARGTNVNLYYYTFEQKKWGHSGINSLVNFTSF